MARVLTTVAAIFAKRAFRKNPLLDLAESLMSFRPQPHYGLPINRLETYREDELGWCRYGEVRKKGTTEVVDLLE